jgi:hypothetical protein
LAEDYSGMTVNERLFAAGLMDACDAAVATGDLDKMNRVLAQVRLSQDDTAMNWSMDCDGAAA